MIPARIPVKISSEAAGSVSVSPVVAQQMTPAELIEQILRLTGKDAARVREILERGAVVSGGSRFRWAPFETSPEEISALLAAFPDPQPDRPFDASRCRRAVLAGGRGPIELDREAASRRRWLQKRSFWASLMDAAAALAPVYQQYSYAERADLYRAALPVDAARALRDRAGLLRYPTLTAMVREYAYDRLELWVER